MFFFKSSIIKLDLEKLNKMFTFVVNFGFHYYLGDGIKRESGVNPELFPQL